MIKNNLYLSYLHIPLHIRILLKGAVMSSKKPHFLHSQDLLKWDEYNVFKRVRVVKTYHNLYNYDLIYYLFSTDKKTLLKKLNL